MPFTSSLSLRNSLVIFCGEIKALIYGKEEAKNGERPPGDF
jgi:hypothetical protein